MTAFTESGHPPFRFFQGNKRSLGSPGLPMLWFRALVAEFGKDVVVHLVRTPEQALAAVRSFLWGDTLYAYYSGTAQDADREFSASNFMYMSLREWAVAQGLRRFDFGRSRRDSGDSAVIRWMRTRRPSGVKSTSPRAWSGGSRLPRSAVAGGYSLDVSCVARASRWGRMSRYFSVSFHSATGGSCSALGT